MRWKRLFNAHQYQFNLFFSDLKYPTISMTFFWFLLQSSMYKSFNSATLERFQTWITYLKYCYGIMNGFQFWFWLVQNFYSLHDVFIIIIIFIKAPLFEQTWNISLCREFCIWALPWLSFFPNLFSIVEWSLTFAEACSVLDQCFSFCVEGDQGDQGGPVF